MRKVILLSLLLSGCATQVLIPQQDLLNPPKSVMAPIPKLLIVDEKSTATEALVVIVKNYAITKQMAAQIQEFQDYITQTNDNITKQNAINAKKK